MKNIRKNLLNFKKNPIDKAAQINEKLNNIETKLKKNRN